MFVTLGLMWVKFIPVLFYWMFNNSIKEINRLKKK